MNYDYVIVGSGPCGLTLAWHLAKTNDKILLVEKESTIGGCHRVHRINGLFTEHGPRVIIDNYFSFIDMLSEMGLNFYDIYEKQHNTLKPYISQSLQLFSYKEMLAFVIEFMKLVFAIKPIVTMKEFMDNYKFNNNAIKYVDTICRLTDGGTIENYTLYEFLQILNQNAFYDVYEPKLPNDIGLFNYWQKALLQTENVTFMLDTEIKSIMGINKIDYLLASSNGRQFKIKANNYIFAIPPMPMLKIINNSSVKNMFGDYDQLVKWEKESRYLVYIPIIFHYDTVITLDKKEGIFETDYGLIYMVMSDFMKFNDDRSKTVITCAIKNSDQKSSYNNKTADQCSESELINETIRQLQEIFPELPYPTYSIISPGIYKNGQKWATSDTAYFYTKAGYKPNKSLAYDNLYWVGSHNGNSHYSFTAMETAINNAISLLYDLEPGKHKVTIKKPLTIIQVIHFILLLITLLIGFIICLKSMTDS